MGGGTVGEVTEPKPLPDRLQSLEQLFFAVEAAVRQVAAVGLELDLVGLDLDKPCAHRARQGARSLLLVVGVRGRRGQWGDRPPDAERIPPPLEEPRRIDASPLR